LLPRREFGRSGIGLSAFTFGTMRMAAPRFDEASATDFLIFLHDRGVTSFHVSHEYDSYPLACAALRGLRRARPDGAIETIAKIAEPHFDGTGFEGGRARRLVEEGRRDLCADRIDIVQWLVRQTPNEDAARLPVLTRDAARAEEVWGGLKAAGHVGALAVFPYSEAFMAASLDYGWIDGLVTYLNLAESEAAPHLDRLHREGRGFAAIRPLLAGGVMADARLAALDPDQQVRQALQFPLLHPACASAILGVSSRAHAEAALDAIGGAQPDRARFHAMAQRA
jgi:aryl-alcohol dehydrogenase-like predicted oxidoreductase